MLTDPATIAAAVLLGGVAGAVGGALLNAVATRLPVDLTALGPPACTTCKTELPTGHLLPFARGACPHCGAPTPWHKTATELGAAALTILALLLHGFTYQGLTTALFSLVLLLILRIDWVHHLIYVVTIAPPLMVALALAGFHSPGRLLSVAAAAAGAGLVFLLFFALALLIYRTQALGFGDILLVVLIGAMTGHQRVVPAIFLGMVLAAAGGLLLIALRLRTRRDYIPYGAYLCAGTIAVLLFG